MASDTNKKFRRMEQRIREAEGVAEGACAAHRRLRVELTKVCHLVDRSQTFFGRLWWLLTGR